MNSHYGCKAGLLLKPIKEVFDLFSRTNSSLSLGHLTAGAATGTDPLTLSIPGLSQDLTIAQSPALLRATLPGGTTGAVLWRLQPLLAAWLLQPGNLLFAAPLLGPDATMLELGTSIGGVLAVALARARRVARFVATDQPYVLRGLRANLAANMPPRDPSHVSARMKGRGKSRAEAPAPAPVDVFALDWETSAAESMAGLDGLAAGPDAVLACDCVYNESLVAPFVRTCAEACRVRCRWRADDEGASAGSRVRPPAVCVIAQQLRAPEVLEEWLRAFMTQFHVWRVRDDEVGDAIKVSDGYVVHLGILKEEPIL